MPVDAMRDTVTPLQQTARVLDRARATLAHAGVRRLTVTLGIP
jgi:hypothetical protein